MPGIIMLSAMKQLHNTTDVDTCKRAIRAIEIQTFYQEHPELEANTQPHPVDNAVIVGVGSRAEIWDAQRWAAYNEESSEDVNELAEQLADLGI